MCALQNELLLVAQRELQLRIRPSLQADAVIDYIELRGWCTYSRNSPLHERMHERYTSQIPPRTGILMVSFDVPFDKHNIQSHEAMMMVTQCNWVFRLTIWCADIVYNRRYWFSYDERAGNSYGVRDVERPTSWQLVSRTIERFVRGVIIRRWQMLRLWRRRYALSLFKSMNSV